ncbi:sugar porter (SP) family MFS transporter [Psychromicrobium silvestre]|uniref:Sugar porter (SP) family MFS transporter n=1 Tax=Psychromicrobium silvestre TaxID=1645614 RepID=A0A7Y9LU61_9MICC|nr:sugar porter family MFS transporter [Psychromicrobium silvestre]NYE95624.1 sugar porter (SP) family MFS transporter [Psychromicrobium silvestre]
MVTDSRKLQLKVIGLAISAAVGGFLFGFDSSVVNGAVDAIESRFGLSSGLTGLAVASALLGSALGAYLAGRIADRWGRKVTMLIGAILFFVSSIGAGAAFEVWDLVLWRIIGGLGIGIASVVAPAYIAEISPKLIRGRLASLQQLAITLGIFAALLSDTLFANSAGSASATFWLGLEAWRWMFIACALPALIYGLLALRLPESPRYLMQKGREQEATKVFSSLWPAADVTKAVKDIRSAIAEDAKAKRASLFGGRFGLLPIVWIGIALSMFQQFVGINVIFYYSTTLWKSVGFQESDSLFISVVTSVTNVAVTVVAILLVDRLGRRPILLAGSIGMAVSLGAMALAFSTASTANGEVQLSGIWGPVALVAANIFVIAFGVSWGPLVWVLLGEIFPNRIRAKALGVAAMAQWISNFVITVSFPGLASMSLSVTYAIYAAFAALSFVFVFFKIPETNGMSLEEAETLFVKKPRSGKAENTLSTH